VKLHEAVLFTESFAVHVTVVVPRANEEPDAGTQTSDATVPQLSDADGA
jgi:hypothetical protein